MAKKENKHVELHWLEGYKLDVDEDGFKQKSWNKKYEYVAQSSTKRYYNCLYLLCRLSPCARNLVDYMSEVMDKDNMVNTSAPDRKMFIEFMAKITRDAVTYSDSAIKKALQELKAKNLIIPKYVGRALVNPLYFFSESDAKRMNMIKLTIKIGTELADADFKWQSEDVVPDSKLAKHRAIAKEHMLTNKEINL